MYAKCFTHVMQKMVHENKSPEIKCTFLPKTCLPLFLDMVYYSITTVSSTIVL